jgi:hypothetical protein
MTFHIFLAEGATHVGTPSDINEAERVEWVPWSNIRTLIEAREILDGMSVTGLLYALAITGLS